MTHIFVFKKALFSTKFMTDEKQNYNHVNFFDQNFRGAVINGLELNKKKSWWMVRKTKCDLLCREKQEQGSDLRMQHDWLRVRGGAAAACREAARTRGRSAEQDAGACSVAYREQPYSPSPNCSYFCSSGHS